MKDVGSNFLLYFYHGRYHAQTLETKYHVKKDAMRNFVRLILVFLMICGRMEIN